MRELFLGDTLAANLFHLLTAAVILTLTGPFGTYVDFDVLLRFQFWFTALVAAGLFIHSVCYISLKISNDTVRSSFLAVIVGASLGSVPATAVVMKLYSYYNESPIDPQSFPSVWSNVTIIGILVALFQFRRRIFRLDQSDAVESAENLAEREVVAEGVPPNVPLLDRLPKGISADQIISFSMQDHYVEVMTIHGPHLVLLRLADAIVLLGDLKGLRIHRSHWIALNHLDSLKKHGRAWQAVMSDGRQLPISATYFEAVRTALETKSAA